MMMAAVHGMLVLGTQTVFVSHLPMFHAPHDYQFIAEVDFDPAAKTAYLKSKAAFPETVYTIEPEKFDLPQLIAHPHPFRARLYRGHFERGGTPIANVLVTPKRLVFAKRFQPGAAKPRDFRGITFGAGSEVFTAHEIVSAPDFDQIVMGRAPPGLPNAPIPTRTTQYLEFGDLAH